jgi:hypothetical protein
MPKESLNLRGSHEALKSSFPALRALGLGDDDLAIVRRNGYLQQDRRACQGGGYWRLRFRKGGRLRTVYLGREPRRVDPVKRELSLLQARRTARREQVREVRQGREVLRGAKARLAPILEQYGYHFHGDVIRKLRRSSAPPTNSKNGEDEYGHA